MLGYRIPQVTRIVVGNGHYQVPQGYTFGDSRLDLAREDLWEYRRVDPQASLSGLGVEVKSTP